MLRITNLNAGYADLHILKDVNLSLQPGTVSVLLGPNGAGKSTLLKSIFHLTGVMSGEVWFEEENITHHKAHELLSRGIAFVSQGRINFGLLSVKDNLLLGAPNLTDKKEVRHRLAEIYKEFPVLKEREDAYAFSLSGGQQQMLAIARALMGAPKLLLMDEPSLGLSPKLVKEVFQKIVDIRTHFNTTILVVEHNIKSLMNVADYGYIMVQGKIVAHDTCEKLKKSDIMQKVFVGSFE